MQPEIYKPFDKFNFGNRTCFLTGKPLQSEEEKIQFSGLATREI